MTFFHTIILGIVEGITEFLPISSTAHLSIVGALLRIPDTDFQKSFNIIIQLGAISAIVCLYIQKIFISKTLWRKVAVASLPALGIGFILYALIKNFLIGNTALMVTTLILGGILMIVLERVIAEKNLRTGYIGKPLEILSYKDALIIGMAQSLAIIPGVSRSAATIFAGLLQGYSRVAIIDFSFLLAIPVMIAASGYDILKSGSLFSSNDWVSLGIGFVVSFISALVAVRWLLRFIKTHTFTYFGVYRIIFGVVVWYLLFL